jgi:hypothetical protein
LNILPRTRFLPGRKADLYTAGTGGTGAERVAPPRPETNDDEDLLSAEERPVTRGREERGGAARE